MVLTDVSIIPKKQARSQMVVPGVQSLFLLSV
jgi:hypothetical protein